MTTWQNAVDTAARCAQIGGRATTAESRESYARLATAWVMLAAEIRAAALAQYPPVEPDDMFGVARRCHHDKIVTTVVPGSTPAGQVPAGSLWLHPDLSDCDDPQPQDTRGWEPTPADPEPPGPDEGTTS